jgi:adenylosuccinate synthase
MAHHIRMVVDFQYGSTGKGLIAGWLAMRENFDTAVCAFSTNAGHTYITAEGRTIMTQQLPTSIVSPAVKTVLIGPGAAIDMNVLTDELMRYADLLEDKTVLIHPQAAIVTNQHAAFEQSDGRTKMGSTAKGVGEAYIERMRRKPNANTFGIQHGAGQISRGVYVATPDEYRDAIRNSQRLMIEGAQGYSLSLYHGQYPFVTSRDVTPWQIAADCGLSFDMAPYIRMVGTLRTYPIRVNNRDGSSGPCYPDQFEIDWEDIGIAPELTTVTKLPRRIFSFSFKQLREAVFHCGGYWNTDLFLNFCNYIPEDTVERLITKIEEPGVASWNPPKVVWTGHGPNDVDVRTRKIA